MNIYQLIVLGFALLVIGISLGAIWAILRTPELRYKPLWIIGSLFGFIGLGINWTAPDDVVILFGVVIPVVNVFTVVATSQTIVKTGIPFVALAALGMVLSARRGQK